MTVITELSNQISSTAKWFHDVGLDVLEREGKTPWCDLVMLWNLPQYVLPAPIKL